MKKRNLAMAMAAVTVVGSAAPVFAAASDVISLQDGTNDKYTVSNTKASDLVKDILAAQNLTTGAVILNKDTKVTFYDANEKDSSTPTGDKKVYSEQILTTANGNEDYVKTTLKNLDAGEYAIIDLTYNNAKTVEIKVVAASEKTVVVSSDAKNSAKDIAEKYVFEDKDLENALKTINASDFSKTDSYYQVVLYPKGKRLQGFSTYRATNYNEGTAYGNTPVILTLKSTSKSNLKTAVEELQKLNASYSNTTTLAGDDRIQTAIEISKEYYNNDGEKQDHSADVKENVKNVVLVGANALVDGLVAAPLAAEKDAPLLLTSKDKLDSSVKSEIKRVLDLKTSTEVTGKTVYIAGGVNSVSKEVVTELESMGLKVERFSGDDRYETSLKIADEIGLDNDKAYVVGGTGLADAMSIASVASTKLDGNGVVDRTNGHATPIVVVDGKADKISDDLDSFLGSADVDIIGGFASVSEKMEEAISDATGKGVTRVKGDDRQDTNSEVIKTYYANDTEIAKAAVLDKDSGASSSDAGVFNFYVAKDGSTKEDQLVDALAVGAVAGYKLAPVVLATDSLSSDQSVAISKVVGEKYSKDLTQVGQGIANSVINKIKDLLDM
ncbi:UNVERIFIED_CONTAM: S-layer protein SlpA [Clostridioides difficile]|uniref:S-layer protein n=2 Tax=Clostridioides difficile TaxID=1496 RepID=Q2N3V7_CLODI|nr:S-layer protein SlpA [Clostridioides difficile]EQG74561.1 cell wall binding repeat 2 family protein [Clostridioides difficile DA00165]AAZ05972.1 S-layer protein precursor [Clostridioides difficile]AXU28904.1 S-layer protein [Clostridioides difficile]AXU32692.1 S-layer protein [Clostridioides difficile]AXU36480.1 S-layer protein [Clostridioides difficile]